MDLVRCIAAADAERRRTEAPTLAMLVAPATAAGSVAAAAMLKQLAGITPLLRRRVGTFPSQG